MRIAFEICKLLFLVVILSIATLQYTGSQLMDVNRQEELINLLLPAFFVLGGLMMGWIMTLFLSQEIDPSEKLLVRGFIVGLIIGVGAVILYFLGGAGTV